jgi:hypothetical protein
VSYGSAPLYSNTNSENIDGKDGSLEILLILADRGYPYPVNIPSLDLLLFCKLLAAWSLLKLWLLVAQGLAHIIVSS